MIDLRYEVPCSDVFLLPSFIELDELRFLVIDLSL